MRIRLRTIVGILAVATCLALADDEPTPPPPPTSPQAVAAMTRRDIVVAKALEAYQRAVAAADRKEIEELKPAMTSATRAGNLDEANAIKRAIGDAETESKSPPTPPTGKGPKLEGTTWKFNGLATLKYFPDGVVSCDTWKGNGTWVVTGPNTIMQKEPSGISEKITFAADGTACLWEYDKGDIGCAKIQTSH